MSYRITRYGNVCVGGDVRYEGTAGGAEFFDKVCKVREITILNSDKWLASVLLEGPNGGLYTVPVVMCYSVLWNKGEQRWKRQH